MFSGANSDFKKFLSYFHEKRYDAQLTVSCHWSLTIPPENIAKPVLIFSRTTEDSFFKKKVAKK